MKQVLFYDEENDVMHGGIMTDEGDIICGCCGGLIPADEVGDNHDHQVLKVFDHWIDLDEKILSRHMARRESIREVW